MSIVGICTINSTVRTVGSVTGTSWEKLREILVISRVVSRCVLTNFFRMDTNV